MPSAWDSTSVVNGTQRVPPKSAWDATPAKPLPAKTQQDQGRGIVGNAVDFGNAAMHHVGNFLHGTAQLIENGIGAGVHKVAPGSAVDNYLQPLIAGDNSYMRNREQSYQAQTPNSPGAYAGAAVGEVAPFLFGGASKGVNAIGDIGASAMEKLGAVLSPLGSKLAQNVGRGVAQGAAISATAPVTNEGDYWNQKLNQVGAGAAIGGALPVAGKAISGVASQIKGVLAPWINPQSLVGPVLEKISGKDPAALADALRNYETIVPGSTPTTAQILQTPAAVMAEKTVANTGAGKVAMAERQASNNAARLELLNQHAGTEGDLLSAIADRTKAAQPFLDALKSAQPVDASPVLEHMDSLSKSSLGTDPVIRSALGDARNILSSHGVEDGNGGLMVSPDILDGIRQNVRAYLSKYASNGAVSSRQEAALGPLKNTIVDTVDSGLPGYRDYLATYAQNSVPVNTMEQLQKLASALDTRAVDSSGNPSFTLNSARQAVNQIDRAKYPISDDASEAIGKILSDLQRESVSNSIRTPGSDTALNLQAPGWLASQLYGDTFSGKPGPIARGIGAGLGFIGGNLADHGLAGAGAGALAASKLSTMGSDKVNQALAEALMDPAVAADIAQQRINGQGSGYTQKLAAALSRAPLIAPYLQQTP